MCVTNWLELGCALPLTDSLACVGINQPTEVQSIAWQPLRESEQDTALVAEAGSGKTLAYLVPLVDKLLAAQLRLEREATLVGLPSDLIHAERCVASPAPFLAPRSRAELLVIRQWRLRFLQGRAGACRTGGTTTEGDTATD